MCCGNGKKNGAGLAAARQSRSSSASGEKAAMMARATAFTAGADQVEIEYQLPKAGRVLYTGKVTGKQYAFSSTHARNYVDMRDAPAFLSRIEDRRHAFLLVDSIILNQNPQPPPMPEEVRKPEPVGVITQEIDIKETVEVAEAPKPRKPRKSQ